MKRKTIYSLVLSAMIICIAPIVGHAYKNIKSEPKDVFIIKYNYLPEIVTKVEPIVINEITKTENIIIEEPINPVDEVMLKLNTLNTSDEKYEWYLEYKSIMEDLPDDSDKPETIYDYFTDEEIHYLRRMIETETYQQDFMSKVHVANVALNRYQSGKYRDLKHVITALGQFVYSRNKISDSTILAAEYAFEIEDETNGSTFFHHGKKTNTFNGAYYFMTDDCGHHFYKEGDND